jgi:hypothetical protein
MSRRPSGRQVQKDLNGSVRERWGEIKTGNAGTFEPAYNEESLSVLRYPAVLGIEDFMTDGVTAATDTLQRIHDRLEGVAAVMTEQAFDVL